MKKGSKILGRVVSFGIMVLSIYLILGVYIMKDEFYIFGYRPVVVLSGSMEPTCRQILWLSSRKQKILRRVM